MYKNVLIPVDISHAEAASSVMRRARALADEDAKFTVLYVMPVIPGYMSSYVSAEELEAGRTEAMGQLEEIGNSIGNHVDALLRKGSAAPVIVETAKELGADLIMIASHSPGLQDYLIGSTAGKVVRHAKCSVLVVR